MIRLFTEINTQNGNRCIDGWIININDMKRKVLVGVPVDVPEECLARLKHLGEQITFSKISAEAQNAIIEHYNHILLYEISYNTLLYERLTMPEYECCGYVVKGSKPHSSKEVISPEKFELISTEGKKAYIYGQWNFENGWIAFLDKIINYVAGQIYSWSMINGHIQDKEIRIVLVYD